MNYLDKKQQTDRLFRFALLTLRLCFPMSLSFYKQPVKRSASVLISSFFIKGNTEDGLIAFGTKNTGTASAGFELAAGMIPLTGNRTVVRASANKQYQDKEGRDEADTFWFKSHIDHDCTFMIGLSAFFP